MFGLWARQAGMPVSRHLGPWRAVPVLGATQILAWGTLFYPPVLTLPAIATDRGWSITFAMAGFSLALLAAGGAAPLVGRLIDRHGGHRVMPIGSLLGALGLVGLAHADHPAVYLAVWAVLGLAIAASLYDPAFATLGRIFGAAARVPITALTLAGGFASTVSWPVTYALLQTVGWRGTYMIYAVVLAVVAAPLHAWALPRARAADGVPGSSTPPKPAPARAHGAAIVLVAAAFAAYAFVPSALSAHLLAMFVRSGIDAATVVAIGALFGPSQVAVRIVELLFARGIHPLTMARLAVAALLVAFGLWAILGTSVAVAAAFMVLFGAANGLITISRGTVPLVLFGPVGYGGLIGRIAGPSLFMQGIAPLTLAYVIERGSDAAALTLVAALALGALGCLLMLRRPQA